MDMKTVVLGSGGWGTALAMVLCDNGHDVTLWSHSPEKAALMAQTRRNPLLPNVELPAALKLDGNPACVKDAEIVVSASPSYAVRSNIRLVVPFLKEGAVLVSVSKGIERDTNLRMSQLLLEETKGRFPVTALSGPSHAEEVSIRLPTGCVAAGESGEAVKLVQDAFMNRNFRVYTSPDIVGVELGGALKNVVALSCGICDGMGYRQYQGAFDDARHDRNRPARETLGGQRQTFAGLAGMGDLIVTCTSMHSRNRRAGILIGQGKTAQGAMEEVGAVVEGYYAAESVYQQLQPKRPGWRCPSAPAPIRCCIRSNRSGTWLRS